MHDRTESCTQVDFLRVTMEQPKSCILDFALLTLTAINGTYVKLPTVAFGKHAPERADHDRC
jgi:hypothetical protein